MAEPQVQPLYAVTSAAQVPLIAKQFARGVAIEEDASGAAAGLKVTWPNGNVANYSPAQQPIIIGVVPPVNGSPLVGVPANYSGAANPATVYCQVESMGAATEVRVTEYN
jgi:hypothetical protein